MTLEMISAIAALCLTPNGRDTFQSMVETRQLQLECQVKYIECVRAGTPLDECVAPKVKVKK